VPDGEGFNQSIEALPLPDAVIDFIRDEWGIENLHPPQMEALPHAMEGGNLLLATPTASGKSLVAYLAIMRRLLITEPGSRAFYLVPLKALANEKVAELKEIGGAVGLEVGLAIGDRDGEQDNIDAADIIVCTTEKLDSLLRNRPELLERVSIVIADELHLLTDVHRGPTLEVVLTRLRHSQPNAQRIALSATVSNADELAAWLEAKLIESDWRPVVLHQGTLAGLKQTTHRSVGPGSETAAPASRILLGRETMRTRAVLMDSIDESGQLLIFVSTRASAEKEARDLGKHVRKWLEAGAKSAAAENGSERLSEKETEELSEDDNKPNLDSQNGNSLTGSKNKSESTGHLVTKVETGTNFDPQKRITELDNLATQLLEGGAEPSNISGRLATAVKGGVAFHHAGLTGRQRRLVEDAFKGRILFCISATPTLAAGVNLPARRVLIRDHRRYEVRVGSQMPMSVMEIHQMLGRAGRPGFDTVGEGWIMAKHLDEENQIKEKYIDGTPEPISSKLANRTMREVEDDPALLTHVLAAVATGGLTDRDMLNRFFDETLLARQMNASELQDRIDMILSWLVEHEMIIRNGESEAVRDRITERISTELGKQKYVERQELEASELPDELGDDTARIYLGDKSEEWDDTMPVWASVAAELDGIVYNAAATIDPPRRNDLPARRGPAVFGFSTARKVQIRTKPTVPEPLAMTYESTLFGETIARLYLNPVSGHIIRSGTRIAATITAGEDSVGRFTPFSILHMISTTPDFVPLFSRAKEEIELNSRRVASERERLVEDDNDLGRIKSVVTMEDWISEKTIQELEKNRGVQPGDLRLRLDLAEWLLYATKRLVQSDDSILSLSREVADEVVNAIDEIHRRIRHGCLAELLPLVALPRIGRVRAREMYDLGIATPDDLVDANLKLQQKLADLRGWSPQLVGNLTSNASKLLARQSRN